MRCKDGTWCIDDICYGGERLCDGESYEPKDETMVDLGGGMVVPLSELMDDDD